jgi:hypothetical protein
MDVWQSGNYIVMHRSARLPDRCIITGEPAYRTVWQLISCSYFPEWVQVILKTLLALPGIGILLLPIVYIVQYPMIIQVPLSASEYFQYHKKIWRVWQGAFVAEVTGFILLQLTQINEMIGLIGFVLIFSAPLIVPLLLLDRIWIVGLYKVEKNFRWVQIRGGGGAFLSRLPSWDEKLKQDEKNRFDNYGGETYGIKAQKRKWSLPVDWHDRIPPRFIGLIFMLIGGNLTYETIRIYLSNKPILKDYLIHYLLIGTLVFQTGIVYLIGGKKLVKLLFPSRSEVTVLGGFFLVLIGLISLLIILYFSFLF